MRELERPVARVFRRLRYQRFLIALFWSWAITLAIVAGVIAGEKLLHRSVPVPQWVPFAIAAGAGLLIAAGFSLATGPSRLDAAIALDRVFHLNERVSTALSLPEHLRNSPAGEALLSDAVRKVADLDVASEFGLRIPRRAWVMLVPAAVAILLLFAEPLIPQVARARAVAMADTKALSKQSDLLTKKISSQRQSIDKEKFPEAEKLLAQIEKKSEDLAKAPPASKDKMMVELNSLTDALKDRQKQLGSPEQVKRQLKQLKEMGSQGPADQLVKDLARGDFQKAADQLKQLQEKLASGKMNESDKKALKEQLAEMSKKLGELANLDQRKKQLEEARKNGGLTEQQFNREMEKLQEQSKQLKQLQKLASKLGEAQKALQAGDAKKAAESLGMTQQQMQDMAKQLEELQSLDGAMAELQDAKNGMTGEGMNQLGDDLNSFGMGYSKRKGGMGNGGRGRGEGDRPIAPDETATYTTKVKQQLKKGKAVFQGLTAPTNTVKGDVNIQMQEEMEAAEGLAADALSNQKIPRHLEKHIRAYYDQLNKGN
jgi:myosin heavy subunit